MKYTILSFIFLFFISCNHKDQSGHSKNTFKKDSLWIDSPNIINTTDTTEFSVYYTLKWEDDSIGNETEKFVYLYWTFEEISKEKTIQIVEEQDIDESKKFDLKRYNITSHDSLTLSHKFQKKGTHHLSGLLDAILVIKDREGKGDSLSIISQAFFQKKIEVKE